MKNWIQKIKEGDESLREIRGKLVVPQWKYDMFKENGMDMSQFIVSKHLPTPTRDE